MNTSEAQAIEVMTDRIETAVEFINTICAQQLELGYDVYAAYAVLKNLDPTQVRCWAAECEEAYVGVWYPDTYIMKKYDVWKQEDIDYYVEKEQDYLGILVEIADYWFKLED